MKKIQAILICDICAVTVTTDGSSESQKGWATVAVWVKPDSGPTETQEVDICPDCWAKGGFSEMKSISPNLNKFFAGLKK